MNKIQAAYQKLGVAPGSSLETAKKRYRQLAMVWHPDRMPTPEGRRTAEEELKQINNAFDCIKKHFETDHRQGPNCECQPNESNSQTGTQNQSNGCRNTGTNGNAWGGQSTSNQHDKTTYEKWAEQEASAEEAHEEALKKALEQAKRAAEATTKAKKGLAAKPTYSEQQLRWHVATGLAVVFTFILIGGFNKRYEPRSIQGGEFSLSAKVEHLRPSPFLN